jgi:hypothetical protein
MLREAPCCPADGIMNPLLSSLIALVCIRAGALIGMFVRNRLPKGNLDADTKDVVRLGTGLIATIAGLVLGLLVASANTIYETKSDELEEFTANIALLDTTLAQYGRATYSAAICPNV